MLPFRPARLALSALAILLIALFGELASADSVGALRWHTVAPGQRLDGIAKRYKLSIEAICTANDMTRRDTIRPGQRLVLPIEGDDDGTKTREQRLAIEAAEEAKSAGPDQPAARGPDDLQTLDVPGAPNAFYYEPSGPMRRGLRPVVMYLHGRGGDPASDCRRWAPVARRFGWVVCPAGPEDRGGGARGWNNSWPGGHRVTMATLAALRAKYGRRVQLQGNLLAGFSEGALVAMNVAVREPRTFSRLLVLAANMNYWGMEGRQKLQESRGVLRRVYLITGQLDGVYDSTLEVKQWITQSRVPVRSVTPSDMGHELVLEKRAGMYHAALQWLDRGTGR